MLIKDLWFSKEDEVFKQFKTVGNKNEEDNCLEGLSRVNIFIGPNNSGKSRFLRRLFSEIFKFNPNSEIVDMNLDFRRIAFKEVLKKLNKLIGTIAGSLGMKDSNRDFQSLLKLVNDFIEFDKIGQGAITFADWKYIKKQFYNEEKYSEKLNRILVDKSPSGQAIGQMSAVKVALSELKEELLAPKNSNNIWKNHKTTLIPVLRSLKKINGNSILERFFTDYFHSDNNIKSSIEIGDGFYSDLKDKKSGIAAEQNLIREFESYLSQVFFNSKSVILGAPSYVDSEDGRRILTSQSDVSIKIGNELDLPITKLGDGIQAVLGLSYPLFLNSNNTHFLFIDEPELNLHPGFQRIFLETLLNKRFENTQVFICTHSNHFLDMSIDYNNEITIYSFNKKINDNNPEKSEFQIRRLAGTDQNVLQDIGVRNSSVFLSNCTIWVEGITDRLYIKTWLAAYNALQKLEANGNDFREYREDLHYSFVEYGGANITHWSFLDEKETNEENEKNKIYVKSLCSSFLLIADRDDTNKKNGLKSQRLEQLQKVLEDKFIKLGRREIENLLSPEIINQTVSKIWNETDLELKDYNAYMDVKLGEYLESKTDNKSMAAGSGTIKQKVKFCHTAVEIMKERIQTSNRKKLEDLLGKSEATSNFSTPYQLVEQIYNFINENNNNR